MADHQPAGNWSSSFPDMVGYRARRAGAALAIQKKLENRYDEEDALGTPTRICNWMNEILEGSHGPCPKDKWQHMQWFLRDGTAMCKLVNKLRVHAGMPETKYVRNAMTPFQAMENIETFNRSAVEYGIPDNACFQSVDLYEGHKGPFINVINCLNKLGFLANQKGYPVKFESVEAPRRDNDTWEDK